MWFRLFELIVRRKAHIIHCIRAYICILYFPVLINIRILQLKCITVCGFGLMIINMMWYYDDMKWRLWKLFWKISTPYSTNTTNHPTSSFRLLGILSWELIFFIPCLVSRSAFSQNSTCGVTKWKEEERMWKYLKAFHLQFFPFFLKEIVHTYQWKTSHLFHLLPIFIAFLCVHFHLPNEISGFNSNSTLVKKYFVKMK